MVTKFKLWVKQGSLATWVFGMNGQCKADLGHGHYMEEALAVILFMLVDMGASLYLEEDCHTTNTQQNINKFLV